MKAFYGDGLSEAGSRSLSVTKETLYKARPLVQLRAVSVTVV